MRVHQSIIDEQQQSALLVRVVNVCDVPSDAQLQLVVLVTQLYELTGYRVAIDLEQKKFVSQIT